VAAYSVSPTTAKSTLLGSISIVPTSGIQIVHPLTAPFLYVVGFTSATQEYIWTYAVNSKGMPNAKPIQTLSVNPSLNQFIIHPNGKFPYAMFSSTVYDRRTRLDAHLGKIKLFTINAKTGLLTSTKKIVMDFPFMPPGTDVPMNEYYRPVIYGMNTKGTQFFTEWWPEASCGKCQINIVWYMFSAANATGSLAKPRNFWGDNLDFGEGIAAIGDSLIAMPASCCGQPDIGIYPNVPFVSQQPPPHLRVHHVAGVRR
jgi:hypothetical protein